MPQTIRKQKIREKLEILHLRLPKPPTAIQGLYKLPSDLADNALNSKFSQESIQKISDHIGYFLGILKSIRVKVAEEYLGERWVGTANGSLSRDATGSPVPGFYRANTLHNEIEIIRKPMFTLKHILGILAHESTHNYLNYRGIREEDELENEILTDVAAVYLGLGTLLLEGYKPISWIDSATFTASGYTTYTLSVGYLHPDGILYAFAKSAELRQLEEFSSVLPLSDRIMVSYQFWKVRRRKEKKKRQIEGLLQKIDRVKSLYDRTLVMMQKTSANMSQRKIPPEDGYKLVEIANALTLGQTKLKLEELTRNANRLKDCTEIEVRDLCYLSTQANDFLKIILDWDRIVKKYVG
ncbi:MAG: hypothetical protein QME90_03885 [Thermodesulfobacteriota bacterium]|nr:hypothetical protein [Thermodesulfobacteriota bacterium]